MKENVLSLKQLKVGERSVNTSMSIKGCTPSRRKAEAAEILVEVQE